MQLHFFNSLSGIELKINMKTLLVILACAALLAAIAKSSPTVSRDKAIEAAIEKALEQVIEETVVQGDEETTPNNKESQIQDIFADEQFNNVQSQFFKKLWKKVKKFGKKIFKVAKKGYDLFNRVKNCPESPEMPPSLEEAAIEAFLSQEKSALIQSMRARARTEDADGDDDNGLSSEQLQALFANRPTQAGMQFSSDFFNKALKWGHRAYNVYNKLQSGECAQLQELPEGLADAMVEAFVAKDKDALKMAALFELLSE